MQSSSKNYIYIVALDQLARLVLDLTDSSRQKCNHNLHAIRFFCITSYFLFSLGIFGVSFGWLT